MSNADYVWCIKLEGECLDGNLEFPGRRVGFFTTCAVFALTLTEAKARVCSSLSSDKLKLVDFLISITASEVDFSAKHWPIVLRDLCNRCIVSGQVEFDSFHCFPIDTP